MGAAQLYARLLHQAVDTALQAAVGPVELWCAGADHSSIEALMRLYKIPAREQSGADLGTRMCVAFDAMLRSSQCAIVVGSDCPARTSDDFREAKAALLGGDDVVLGPTEDGGYHLIGLRRSQPLLFSAMPWSSDHVLEQTRKRVQQLGLHLHELALRWDIDRPADLQRLLSDPVLARLADGIVERRPK
jgi:rSAM/selenodomain-associated transferase 1